METLFKLTQAWPYIFIPLWVASFGGLAWTIWKLPRLISKRGLKLGKKISIPAQDEVEKTSPSVQIKAPEPLNEELQIEVTRLREELKYARRPQIIRLGPEAVSAYIRLKPDIEFFGDWNGHDHFEQIQMVSMLWDPKEHTSVGFLKSNILSEFISLIIQKVQEMDRLEIFCSPKQRSMLETYLREYIQSGKVTITVRGADSEPG